MKGSMSMSIKTICYLSFGYPTIEKSIEMAGRYIEGGCDAIEVSIPPKDPYRDSAFLQELYRVALAQTDDYRLPLCSMSTIVLSERLYPLILI